MSSNYPTTKPLYDPTRKPSPQGLRSESPDLTAAAGKEICPRAFDWPETRAAIGRRRRNCWLQLLGGLCVFTSVVAYAGQSSEQAIVLLGIVGLAVAGIGLLGLLGGLLISSKLKRASWREWPAAYFEIPSISSQAGRGLPLMGFFDPEKREVFVMSPFAIVPNRAKLTSIDGVAWLCGDPKRFGIVAPRGGGKVFLCQRLANRRKHYREKMLEGVGIDPHDWSAPDENS
jgi:hypothetical protein